MIVRKTVTATTITTAQSPLQSPRLKQPLKPLLYLQQQLPQTRSIRGASSLAYVFPRKRPIRDVSCPLNLHLLLLMTRQLPMVTTMNISHHPLLLLPRLFSLV
ncbi:hypothetical protein SLEP1_g44836 [Rubroshorea leprosula]|uniref:Uncharacterized protein n=1 Tax=Rubroshorea leprosula TaxID=152421 RepID=A0AAV5LHU2_9ROSI|nr:hypothetical protein SLEP1_g44836 [Rubroshorea leprosula]